MEGIVAIAINGWWWRTGGSLLSNGLAIAMNDALKFKEFALDMLMKIRSWS